MTVPVVVIFAPTATGKTALALRLFGKSSLSFFKGKAELISADSMQVYRGLNIGTAKPSKEEQSELKHHLIDVRNFTEQFSAADFVYEADALCKNIFASGKIPIIAGGTGFYIRSFIMGLPKTPESDEKVRSMLKARLAAEGNAALYNELCRVDPESGAKINVNDAYRILRALEVFYSSGKPRSAFALPQKPRSEYSFTVIVLERDRAKLYERINSRVQDMVLQGLYEEVQSLVASGARADMPGMKAIGYREWFLPDGTLNSNTDAVIQQIQKDSRKYAKKQYTFMADIPGANVIFADDEDDMLIKVQNLLKPVFNLLT